MVIPTEWGDFQGEYERPGVFVASGSVRLGGQQYDVRLRLYKNHLYGWMRRDFNDLTMTKVGGANDGNQARPIARERILESLPEAVNSVIGDQ